ncbi:hypothetical protein EIP91_003940 [Steccherinum ochraceum]|uniref:AB hydrolase-1 domain-containing protein n=1 Tax=Steccherinum ochraceum TaxID=92696 RepID=A0A4R0RNR3_9APHY|nr:hypothetical protein EIP91_003940 [Steccherinum ochraceum]
MTDSETKYYHHGRFSIAGGILPDAVTAYRTYGDPKNPCIVFPTSYGSRLAGQVYLIGPGKALDTEKYFVVTFALFSNGESSSPSNTVRIYKLTLPCHEIDLPTHQPAPQDGPFFPAVTYEDNIRAQYTVLTQQLHVQRLRCVVGFSMGGQQAYYWAVMYPDFVERFVCICGSARTSPHNYCFLEGPKAALLNSVDFKDGHYDKSPERGIRAFGRVYCAWAYGQTMFRRKGYLKGGYYNTLNDFIVGEWENMFYPTWDANDILTLARTWQMGDVSKLYANSAMDLTIRTADMKPQSTHGDLEATLAQIKAKGLIMPCKTDLYFPPEDSENEVSAMKGDLGKLVVIDSDWGHMGKYLLSSRIGRSAFTDVTDIAGGNASEEDTKFVTEQIIEFLK